MNEKFRSLLKYWMCRYVRFACFLSNKKLQKNIIEIPHSHYAVNVWCVYMKRSSDLMCTCATIWDPSSIVLFISRIGTHNTHLSAFVKYFELPINLGFIETSPLEQTKEYFIQTNENDDDDGGYDERVSKQPFRFVHERVVHAKWSDSRCHDALKFSIHRKQTSQIFNLQFILFVCDFFYSALVCRSSDLAQFGIHSTYTDFSSCRRLPSFNGLFSCVFPSVCECVRAQNNN